MGELRLEVREYQDETRWRWVLTGTGGALVADHEVRLDPRCWQLEAFRDLLGYLRWHAAPDTAHRSENGCGCWGCSACRRVGSR